MYTQEQYDELAKVIDEWKDKPGPLMPILHSAQEIFGCLDETVQMYIAEKTGVAPTKIYGVATFYTRFKLQPKGKYTIGVCLGTACYVRGAKGVLDAFCDELGIQPGGTTKDGLFTLDAVRCIGCCGLGPAVMINEDVYGKCKPETVHEIIEKYRAAAAAE